MIVQAFVADPPPQRADYEERNNGPDMGIVNAWLAGLEKRNEWHLAVQSALRNELPVLPFKGGVVKAINSKTKIGALHYLAMWQGLRSEDLRIDMQAEPVMVCSAYGVRVTFTGDIKKLLPETEDEDDDS